MTAELAKEAGRIAILALAASVGWNAKSGDLIQIDSAALSLDAAATALAEAEVIQECEASTINGRLSIACRAASPNGLAIQSYMAHDVAQGEGVIGSLRRGCGGPEANILVLGGGPAMRTSVAALELWVTRFVLVSPMSMASRPASPEELRAGVSCVVMFGRTSDVD